MPVSLPTISIVTPSYNQAAFLEKTIDSVLSQGYSDLEYIVVDGGSTDGSIEVIKKHQDNLAYWISEPDHGHAHALNKGFSKTSGEIMAWINSDDMYTPWCFQVVGEIFAKFPDIMWISGFNSVWNAHGAMTAAWPNKKNVFDFLTGRHKWVQQESVFWRRSLWDKAGAKISENYRLMVDGELWSRFFLYAQLYSVDCILSGYRVHDTNRARLERKACDIEIQKAVSDMRNKCSNEILSTSQRIQTLRALRRLRIPYRFLTTMDKLFLDSSLATASYSSIVWQDGQWVAKQSSYTL